MLWAAAEGLPSQSRLSEQSGILSPKQVYPSIVYPVKQLAVLLCLDGRQTRFLWNLFAANLMTQFWLGECAESFKDLTVSFLPILTENPFVAED